MHDLENEEFSITVFEDVEEEMTIAEKNQDLPVTALNKHIGFLNEHIS